MSLTLAIETSSPNYGVVIGTRSEILAHGECMHDHPSFQSIGELTASLIAETGAKLRDISRIGIDVGPGSLSSVRAGVAYANGLAFSLGVPIYSLSSLELMAAEVLSSRDLPVICMRKAAAGNVYAGLFTQLGPPTLRYGQRSQVIEELAGSAPAICVAGAYSSTVSDVLPETQVLVTGVETPSVLTLYRILTDSDQEPRQPTALAVPLTEAATEFHQGLPK
ncbi:MAG TPA: tRNA (adenosine(37)-N6)-threonylcarbamoyltransferase complex dimerization subunit type 1 TsaB [Streptosporangiaceae bacterium]|nr:tRNA (adenosine(37)-N6)-threonylcarbamoyltransferase complex dimerization subunit type 1 TsaB [Streptosporangiaceae bacterium]